MSSTKNYTEQGGERTVINGTLEITPPGKITFDGVEFKPVEAQAESTAATVVALKDDFNALIEKLKAAGIMLTD